MKEVDKIAFIHLKDGKILSTRSKGREKFYIPGGKREPGESDEQTLVREIREELSVEIDTSTISYLGTFKAQSDGAAEGVVVKMTCYTAAFTGQLAPANEIAEMRWLTLADTDIISAVDQKIFAYLQQQGLLYI